MDPSGAGALFVDLSSEESNDGSGSDTDFDEPQPKRPRLEESEESQNSFNPQLLSQSDDNSSEIEIPEVPDQLGSNGSVHSLSSLYEEVEHEEEDEDGFPILVDVDVNVQDDVEDDSDSGSVETPDDIAEPMGLAEVITPPNNFYRGYPSMNSFAERLNMNYLTPFNFNPSSALPLPIYYHHGNDNESSVMISDDDTNLSDISDRTISPPLTPQPRMTRRNAIFQPRSPIPPDSNQEENDFYDELEVASVQSMNDNPIEDANSTSGGEEEDLNSTNHSDLAPNANSANSDQEGANDNDKESQEAIHQQESTENNLADVDGGKSQNSDYESKVNNDLPLLAPGLTGKDWHCVVCNSPVLPNFRYCSRCFRIRRSWLPQRPAFKKRRVQKSASPQRVDPPCTPSGRTSPSSENRPATTSGEIESTSTPDALNQAFIVDEAAASQSQHDRRPLTPSIPEPHALPSADLDSRLIRPEPQDLSKPSSNANVLSVTSLSEPLSGLISSPLNASLADSTRRRMSLSQPTYKTSELNEDENRKALNGDSTTLCNICYVREKNSAFVHNKTAHLVSCYTCADKILKKTGKCPICRERVFRVVKMINV